MCGRITTVEWDELLAVLSCIEARTPFNAFPDWPAQRQAYTDAFPRSTVPLIASQIESRMVACEKIWGFESHNKGDVIFNTRIENAESSNLWKPSFERRRCVIPVHAFYEPHRTEQVERDIGKFIKQIYRFTDESFPIMLLCGIWKGDRFSVMTRPPNDLVEPIHSRMPVILTEADARSWLSYEDAHLSDDVILKARPIYAKEDDKFGRLF